MPGYRRWGYRKGESQIFDLNPGESLPKGWVDSPAKVADQPDAAPQDEIETEVADNGDENDTSSSEPDSGQDGAGKAPNAVRKQRRGRKPAGDTKGT